MVAWHVIGSAHSARNHPLSPSRSRSPSHQPTGGNCIDRWKLTLWFAVCSSSISFWCSVGPLDESQLQSSSWKKWPLAPVCLYGFESASSNRYKCIYMRQRFRMRAYERIQFKKREIKGIFKKVPKMAEEVSRANLPSSTVCDTSTTSATWRDNSSGCLAV